MKENVEIIHKVKNKYIGLTDGYMIKLEELDYVSICLCDSKDLGYFYAGQYHQCIAKIKGFFKVKEKIAFYMEQNDVVKKVTEPIIGDIPEKIYVEAKQIATQILELKKEIIEKLIQNQFFLGEFVKNRWEFTHASSQTLHVIDFPFPIEIMIEPSKLEITSIFLKIHNNKHVKISVEKDELKGIEKVLLKEHETYKMRYLLK